MNADQFSKALVAAKRKTEIIYHIGNLAIDRLYHEQVDSIGVAAMEAHKLGKCLLFQRRTGPNTCQYLAVKI